MNDDRYYIGSTKNSLEKRLRQHRTKAGYYHKEESLFYETCKDIGRDNMMIEMLREIYVMNREQQLIWENYHYIINKLDKNILNKTQPYLGIGWGKMSGYEYHKEYRNICKEKLKKNAKQYAEENKEKILENKKEYYKNNKDKWIENRIKNREKIRERKRQKYICEKCNKELNKDHKARHEKVMHS